MVTSMGLSSGEERNEVEIMFKKKVGVTDSVCTIFWCICSFSCVEVSMCWIKMFLKFL